METKVEGNDSENKKPVEEAAAVQKTGSGKKKIKRKVVKKKVVGKDDKPESAVKKSDTSDPKTAEVTTTASYELFFNKNSVSTSANLHIQASF
ncbi:hypothetical protein HanXRQr2_Chr17g0830321 [Helianthus annuus]|uniref:Uncharacterized protein n=1 Tax=Helianthus annuus TaxID=4232 RepID=A0A9K3GXM1_HELAN|nr:hypothetical protein HanXRQr2_Chr17g0830321 [Helianthus annuus]KAJ0815425.1 hypothetical protein HanPSC8_Chr17g0797371 [Helianthus annuus]